MTSLSPHRQFDPTLDDAVSSRSSETESSETAEMLRKTGVHQASPTDPQPPRSPVELVHRRPEQVRGDPPVSNYRPSLTDDAHSSSTPYASDDDFTYTPGKRPKRRRTLGGGGGGGGPYLPTHRRRRNTGPEWVPTSWRCLPAFRRSLWKRLYAVLGSLAVVAFVLWRILATYEFQFEMSVYSRKWVRAEFDDIKPLKGCFSNPSPEYNLTRHQAGRHHLLSPGIAMRRGLSCYDFASTIQPIGNEDQIDLIYHTYWRSDLREFGARQAATIEAFIATQPHHSSKLILWSNGAETLRNNKYIKPFLRDWGHIFEVGQANMTALAQGTEIDGLLNSVGLFDARAWVDGDALRLLVLYHYGGIWMDMDMLLTRDLHPLAESEFVIQWDCYDKPYFQMNGAIMHFMKHSPYLCEAFHVMATSPLPAPNTFTWGSHLYSKLRRRLIAAHVPPFAVLPWCFSDPRNCRNDVRIPDPFEPDPPIWGGRRWDGLGELGPSGRDTLETKLGYVFSIHLHNQWEKEFPPGGYIDRLLTGFRDRVARLKAGREPA